MEKLGEKHLKSERPSQAELLRAVSLGPQYGRLHVREGAQHARFAERQMPKVPFLWAIALGDLGIPLRRTSCLGLMANSFGQI